MDIKKYEVKTDIVDDFNEYKKEFEPELQKAIQGIMERFTGISLSEEDRAENYNLVDLSLSNTLYRVNYKNLKQKVEYLKLRVISFVYYTYAIKRSGHPFLAAISCLNYLTDHYVNQENLDYFIEFLFLPQLKKYSTALFIATTKRIAGTTNVITPDFVKKINSSKVLAIDFHEVPKLFFKHTTLKDRVYVRGDDGLLREIMLGEMPFFEDIKSLEIEQENLMSRAALRKQDYYKVVYSDMFKMFRQQINVNIPERKDKIIDKELKFTSTNIKIKTTSKEPLAQYIVSYYLINMLISNTNVIIETKPTRQTLNQSFSIIQNVQDKDITLRIHPQDIEEINGEVIISGLNIRDVHPRVFAKLRKILSRLSAEMPNVFSEFKSRVTAYSLQFGPFEALKKLYHACTVDSGRNFGNFSPEDFRPTENTERDLLRLHVTPYGYLQVTIEKLLINQRYNLASLNRLPKSFAIQPKKDIMLFIDEWVDSLEEWEDGLTQEINAYISSLIDSLE